MECHIQDTVSPEPVERRYVAHAFCALRQAQYCGATNDGATICHRALDPYSTTFARRDGVDFDFWQGARRARCHCIVTDKQRRQRALPSQTLRAAGLLSVARVGPAVTARYGDAPAAPPWPQSKSLAAGPRAIFRQALSRNDAVGNVRQKKGTHSTTNRTMCL